MTLNEAKTIARSLGLTITFNREYKEYKVRFIGQVGENSTYYTDDLEDALDSARMMSEAGKNWNMLINK